VLKEALQYLQATSGDYRNVQDVAEGFPSRVVGTAKDVQLRSLEEFQERPNRIKHRALLDGATAFVNYVNRFKTAESSVYLNLFETPEFVAIIDHHGRTEAGHALPDWNEHRATFQPKLSLEWKAWLALHQSGALTQQGLLEHFEAHAGNLETPEPAVMLHALQKFEEVEKHTYDSAMNLDNGNVSLTYVKGSAQRKVEFPHTMRLWVPVFENETGVFLDGRIRYRTNEGQIRFTFSFKKDPEQVLRDQLRDLANKVEMATGLPCYEGRIASR
jgi:hypothetical protein